MKIFKLKKYPKYWGYQKIVLRKDLKEREQLFESDWRNKMIDTLIKHSRNVIPELSHEFDEKLFKKISSAVPNSKLEYRLNRIFQLKPLLITLMTSIVIILVISFMLPKGTSPKYSQVNNNLMAKMVYNEVSKYNEDLIPVEVNTSIIGYTNDFYYSELKVIESHYFVTSFDFQLEPYFRIDQIGKKVEIIIAIIELKGSDQYSHGNWYTQEIMVIKNQNEIVGFLSGNMMIKGSTPYLPLEGIFNFQSFNFLTKDAVVKYYEKGDQLYRFDVNLTNKENITIDVEHRVAKLDIQAKYYEMSSTVDSYINLSNDILINLLDEVIIEKIVVYATITEIDKINQVIYVQSQSANTLVSIRLLGNGYIVDDEGVKVEFDDLIVDDIIEIYYFNRYTGYVPIDIYVETIKIT